MTVKDYISSKLNGFGIHLSEADLIDVSLIVPLDSEITPETRILALQAIATQVIPHLLLRANSVSENGFSFSWDIDGLLRYYAWLTAELGLDDVLSGSIKDVTKLW